MNDEDIKQISDSIIRYGNAAIIAPAGHGKTEMIVDLVDRSHNKVLLLTHTNAGVSAMKKRLAKKNIPGSKYEVSTIAGFCIRWCRAYPCTAGIDKNIPFGSQQYYSMIYDGAHNIFAHQWARELLQYSAGRVIVDEYQDCIIPQHQIFLEINQSLPVIVLGDPLQAIFGWAGPLVSWNDEMKFNIVRLNTFPWRWKNTNPSLGKYLSDIREILLPVLSGSKARFSIAPVTDCVKVISKRDLAKIPYRKDLQEYHSIVYITNTPERQKWFAQHCGGLFQNDEKQIVDELVNTASIFDKNDSNATPKALLQFMGQCATNIKSELNSYVRKVSNDNYDFSKITKHSDFGKKLLALHNEPNAIHILEILNWMTQVNEFKIYRKKLFFEMRDALRYSIEHNTSLMDAINTLTSAEKYRSDQTNNYRKLSSRTVLSKGLEFECAIIDMGNNISVTDLYVAMTRATRMIYFIIDKKQITLTPPKRKLA